MKHQDIKLQGKEPCILAAAQAVCKGERLQYVLSAKGEMGELSFFVGVSGFGMRSECRVGNDLTTAVEVYGKLVRGAVPPSTFSEILEELLTDAAAESLA